ncbi:hypothetical protein THAOC_26891, partial [Thalassiosira oceanica]
RSKTAILDFVITDTDAPSYGHQPSKKVLEKAAKRKKDKYLEACRERRRDFIPMAYSVDGLAGKEARAAEKRLASLLASKWDRPYSEMACFVKTRMSLSIVRSISMLLRGSRSSAWKRRAPDDGVAARASVTSQRPDGFGSRLRLEQRTVVLPGVATGDHVSLSRAIDSTGSTIFRRTGGAYEENARRSATPHIYRQIDRRAYLHASGVRGDDGVYPVRPSALYTPTGPFGRSVASIDLKQPSMHRRSSICPLRCARDPVTSSFSGVACHFRGPPTSPETEYRGFGRPPVVAEGMVQGEGPLDMR